VYFFIYNLSLYIQISEHFNHCSGLFFNYCVGYVNASTAGKAKSLALSSSLITDGCEFIDLLVYRGRQFESDPCNH
jgi:hypothetical protein